VADTQPLPLQLFSPLQELVAVAQSDVPLQELTPLQCTCATFAAASPDEAVEPPELLAVQPARIKAAAEAMAAADNFFTVLIINTLHTIVVKRYFSSMVNHAV
jgi:hypothetical protein